LGVRDWCDDPSRERRDGARAAEHGYVSHDEREKLRDYEDECARHFREGYRTEERRQQYREEERAEEARLERAAFERREIARGEADAYEGRRQEEQEEEQAGPDAAMCDECGRKTRHQLTGECTACGSILDPKGTP